MSRPRWVLSWALCLVWLVAGCSGEESGASGPNDVTDPDVTDPSEVVSAVVCTVLAEVPGPEDFVVQAEDDKDLAWRLLVSSQDRRTKAEGAIYAVSLRERSRGFTRKMELEGRGDCSFRPHGVFLLEDVTNGDETRDLLYVINHHDDPLDLSADRSCVPAGVGSTGRPTTIEVFQVGTGSLTMIERLTDADPLENGNDLVVHRDGTVYVTVPAGLFKQALEPILFWTESSKVVRSDPGGEWPVVAHLAGYTNGIELIGDDLMVSTSRKGEIYRFPRDTVEHRNLEPTTTFGEMHDNFTWSGESLILATHPEGRRFLQHASHPGARSPSQVWTLNRQGDSWERAMIFEDDGTILSGVSTAACVGDRLILGQVFGPSLLSCPAAACRDPEPDDDREGEP